MDNDTCAELLHVTAKKGSIDDDDNNGEQFVNLLKHSEEVVISVELYG